MRDTSGSTRAARRNHFDNDETEILVIPDLEDDGEEDIVSKGEWHTFHPAPRSRQEEDSHAYPYEVTCLAQVYAIILYH